MRLFLWQPPDCNWFTISIVSAFEITCTRDSLLKWAFVHCSLNVTVLKNLLVFEKTNNTTGQWDRWYPATATEFGVIIHIKLK